MQNLPAVQVFNGLAMKNILMAHAIFIQTAYLIQLLNNAKPMGMILDTGAAVTEEEYKAKNPNGKAFLKGADYHSTA